MTKQDEARDVASALDAYPAENPVIERAAALLREFAAQPAVVASEAENELHRTHTVGPAPHNRWRLSSDAFHVARAVAGTSTLADDGALYRGIQAYLQASGVEAAQPEARQLVPSVLGGIASPAQPEAPPGNDDCDDCEATRERMADILTRSVNALRGDPPALTMWSWHDLPERITALKAKAAQPAQERAIDERRERESFAAWWGKTEHAVVNMPYSKDASWSAWQARAGGKEIQCRSPNQQRISAATCAEHQGLKMKQIVIAQRGWIFVGDVARTGDDVVITDASCIRRWGTTKGLGELASSGPKSATVLDPMGTVRLHALAVVASLDCEESKWAAR